MTDAPRDVPATEAGRRLNESLWFGDAVNGYSHPQGVLNHERAVDHILAIEQQARQAAQDALRVAGKAVVAAYYGDGYVGEAIAALDRALASPDTGPGHHITRPEGDDTSEVVKAAATGE